MTVTAGTTAELRRRRDELTGADLVELRLDGVADPDARAALADRRLPAIVTCRPVWEGGRFRGSEEERRELLGTALDAGAEYIDVEWRAGFRELLARTGGRRIVLSSHDFGGVPADLRDRMRVMRGTGVDVVKIAVQANRLSDCVPLLGLAGPPRDSGVVLIAMGERGLITRVLPARFGSCWTYAGDVTGVGQVPPARLRDEYRFGEVSRDGELYGVVGSPVSHSLSPAMHNAAFRAAGRDAVYLPLPAADTDDFVTFARATGQRGASVTLPFKVPLLARVDEVADLARLAGALNTIHVRDGRWVGRNTDVPGFLRPLDERGVNLQGLRAAVLGAGGSARAVAVALAARGADVVIHARRIEAALDVAARTGVQAGAWPPAPGAWDLLVNCTPAGMYPQVDGTPLDADALAGRAGRLVYDLIYNPGETRLLRDSAAAGCRTIGGLDMLVAQAEEQFHEWTGTWPAPGVMRAAAVRKLAEFAVNEHHLV